MRIVKFDSVGGASGDMILGSLLGLGAPLESLKSALAAALPHEAFEIRLDKHSAHGVSGFRLKVDILKDSEHARCLHDIEHIIAGAPVSGKAKTLALSVFRRLGEAEAKVHGKPLDHIHFHEVGAVDSIIDILGSCVALDALGVDGVAFGPLPEGRGSFKCAHGVMPIPAPATAELLKGVEVELTDEPFELVTPTGAALLVALPQAPERFSGRGIANACAFGSRELERRPNFIRATLFESASSAEEGFSEPCVVLESNVDDLSPEIAGTLFEKLLMAGALDVWTIPCMMKKQRQGLLISVLSRPGDEAALAKILFLESGTLGVRKSSLSRWTLARQNVKVSTAYGEISVKTAFLDGKGCHAKAEFDECLAVAKAKDLPVKTVIDAALTAYFNKEKGKSVI